MLWKQKTDTVVASTTVVLLYVLYIVYITNGRKEKFGNKGRRKEGIKRLQEGLEDLARGLAPIEN